MCVSRAHLEESRKTWSDTATSPSVTLPVHSADEDAGPQRETPGDSHIVTLSKAVEKWHLNTGTVGFLVTMEVEC